MFCLFLHVTILFSTEHWLNQQEHSDYPTPTQTVIHRPLSQSVNWPPVFAWEPHLISIVNADHCTLLFVEFIMFSSAIFSFSCDTTSLWWPRIHSIAQLLFSYPLFSLSLGNTHPFDLRPGAPAETHLSRETPLHLLAYPSLFTEVIYLTVADAIASESAPAW